jgi:hypothetical protein
MNNERGWKKRRDAAVRRNTLTEDRFAIRRARAGVVGAEFTDVDVVVGDDVIVDSPLLSDAQSVARLTSGSEITLTADEAEAEAEKPAAKPARAKK